MYGQIHQCVRSLVVAKFGEEKWREILEHSGCDEIDDFLTFHCYDDSRTIGLIDSVRAVLGVTLETVLELFGEYFFIYCYQNGYDKMLRTIGDDFKSFVQNLDSLHSLLAFSYKNLNAPSFRCEDGDDGTLILHYYSRRKGLHHIVVGLCRSVGLEMFQQNVSVEVLDKSEMKLRGNDVIYHVAFRVLFSDVLKRGKELDISLAEKKSSRTRSSDLVYCVSKESLISSENFCQIFPYHVLFDDQLVIRQCGINIFRWSGVSMTKNINLKDVFTLAKPEMPLTFENIKRFRNANYILEIKDNNGKLLLRLRGEMIPLASSNHILFIGSPRLDSLNEMEERNIFLSDIPLYDVTREFVLLNQQRLAEVEVSKKLDETTAELKRTAVALVNEKKKTELLLHQMLPKKVANQLKEGKQVDAERFEKVTILFSDIVTFTNIAAAVSPIQIVSMLNMLYTRFDELTEVHGVYKVETIGDAYMIVSGAPEIKENHTESVANFSLDMVAAARQVLSPATGEPLQIRVGFHSGPVVAGVVGDKMPRYCLFGDTVNTASRMESHGLPGKIHLSSFAYDSIANKNQYVIEPRGQIEVKGKGLMFTYWLRGFADGSKWNKEYQGTQLLENSTYEYYKKHGLPSVGSRNGTMDNGNVTAVHQLQNGSVTPKSNATLTGPMTQETCKGKTTSGEFIPVKDTCDVKDSASCILL